MGLVTEALLDLLRKQIEAHGTLVWYDPERAYSGVVLSLTPEQIEDASVRRLDLDRGFFCLRHELEPLWGPAIDSPRLLIYVPLMRDAAQHALIEFEVAGCVMRPGQQPPERNTALPVVARTALTGVLPPAAIDQVLVQVEAGQLSLAELDELAARYVEAQTGVLFTLFGTGDSNVIALRFLSDPTLDAEIVARGAVDNLVELLDAAFGIAIAAGQSPAELRARLARHILITDLVESLEATPPGALQTFPLPPSSVAREATVELARSWRDRRNLADSYCDWAGRVQAEVGLSSLELPLEALARSETFEAGESLLQSAVEEALHRRATAEVLALAEERRGGFWSSQLPEVKTRWEVVADAGRVLLEAARVHSALKGKSWSAASLVACYVQEDGPWCELDTAQRRLERDFHQFETDVQQHASLLRVVALARQRYAAAADLLAERFLRACAADHFEMPGVPHQADVYRSFVHPAMNAGPVAYVLVDALRFEMGRELAALLEGEWDVELGAALATPPTITEVGMAALLPGAEKGVAIVADDGGQIAVTISGEVLRTRQERLAQCAAWVGEGFVETKLDRLAPLTDVHLRDGIKAARMVLVTATEEIDGLCESNPALARRTLDDVLNQLRRAVKTMLGLGVATIIISADHGYLFGEALTSGASIDSPGGRTALLKRRVWAGVGGAKSPSYLRAPLSAFGIGGELELATPWNLSCFKVKGGATEYFHGGLSLPEIVIPVLTVRAKGAQAFTASGQIQWTLTPGSQTISTRFFSVTVSGQTAELLPVEPPAVRVEVRAGDQIVSVPVSASYGFQESTKDVQLMLSDEKPQAIAPDTITLLITESPQVNEATVHLLDASTGLSLRRLEHVPLAISL